MSEKITNPDPPDGLTPAANHRRQMLWQVWVPLGITIFLVLACMIWTVFAAVQGSPEIARWGNISAVWVILPWLVVGALIVGIVGGSSYGMFRLLNKMPEWLLIAQLFMVHFALVVRRFADYATKPIVATNTFTARVSTLWGKIFHRKAIP
jgi:hypothetical protein